MAMWNPWRGCKKCSEGCLHCYIHKGDAKRGVDTNSIVKTKDFDKPIQQLKNVSFEFRQCGTNFIKDGKKYSLQTKDLCSQARKANIDFKAVD